MGTKLLRASIVIVADVHNPSIVSPEWLKKYDFIEEKPLQFIYTPDFSVVETKLFNLIIDRQRLQITSKKISKRNLLLMVNVIQKYIEILPHISYRSLGLNFDWLIEKFDENELPSIKVRVGNMTNLKKLFPGHNVNFGFRIFASKEPYILRFTVEPASKNTLIGIFNYHHIIEKKSTETIIGYLEQMEKEYYTLSEKIINRIAKGEA